MTKVNQLDFTGTTIYCGLDVHKISWRLNLSNTELELKDFTQPADASLLHKHLTKNYPGANYKAFRQAEAEADSELQPKFERPTVGNTNVSGCHSCVRCNLTLLCSTFRVHLQK